MNTLTIPASPNWFESSILSCAPDNTIVYGSRHELIIIKAQEVDKPALIKSIPFAHYERVISTDVNRNWSNPDKLIISAGDDKIVKLWDIENYSLKLSHSGHTTKDERVIGAKFAGTDKVVSVSENGFVVLWRLGGNEVTQISHLLSVKTKVTCLSTCPHVSWLVAFGLKNGLIIVTDLRKSGRVLYRLKGHDKSIISLSWCPAPYNLLPKNENEITVKATEKVKVQNETYPEINTSSSNSDNTGTNLESVVDNGENKCEEEPLDREKNLDVEEAQNCNVDTKNREEKNFINTKEDDTERELNNKFKDNEDDGVGETMAETSELELESVNRDIQDISEEIEAGPGAGNENANTEQSTLDKFQSEQISIDNITEFSKTYKDNQSKREFLLASSARGGSIIIWRAGTDGRMHCELQQSKSRGKRNSRANDDKIWVCLYWIKPEILLFSRGGDLMQWDLWKPKTKGKFHSRLVHSDHSSNIFCITAPPLLFETKEECDDWKNQGPFSVWTVGQDRYLLNTSLGPDKKALASYPTIGGHVLCFAVSDLDPNKVAIGFSDGMLRLWDLSRPNIQVITMATAWHKPQSKVVSLAWHPVKEVCLAFGTVEGRIGLLNTNDLSKGPKFLTHYLQNAVHKVEWGPLNGDVNNLGLYACSEGKIILYDTNKSLEEPTVLNLNLSEHVSNMSWKQDYSFLAVGLKTGSVLLFTCEFQLVASFYLQKKTIQNMVWHPIATAEEEGISQYSNLLAVASNDNYIVVYDCSKVEDKTNGILLQGHYEAVKSLSWSPHEGGKLVSGSEDGISLVWDVPKQSVISTYLTNSLQSITAVVWSPLDPDYVIQGGRDSTIQVWKISENPPRTDLDIPAIKRNRSKDTKEIKKLVSSPNTTENEPKESKQKKIPRNFMLKLVSTFQRENSPNLLADCRRLLTYYEDGNTGDASGDDLPAVVKFLGNQDHFLSILEEQQEIHSKTKSSAYQHIALWKGDISETIKDAISNKKLTPWLINLAPMVSPKLWQEACLAYAQSLCEDPKADPYETASYFLACHRVEEAIEALCNATLFRDALAVAKCRLAQTDPLINNILNQWATHSTITGSFEIAAQCFIAMGQIEEAAKAMFRRSDIKSLEFAAELAERTQNKDFYNAVLFRLNAFKSEVNMNANETRSENIESENVQENNSSVKNIDDSVIKENIEVGECEIKNNDHKGVEDNHTVVDSNIIEKINCETEIMERDMVTDI